MIFTYFYKTRIGNVAISSCDNFIIAIKFLREITMRTNDAIARNDIIFEETPTIRGAYRQIEEYFCGKRKKNLI